MHYLKYIIFSVKKKFLLFYLFIFHNNFYRILAIDSHLTILERYKLYTTAKSKQIIAEIGSYIGASACCFGAAVKANGTGKIICIDTWNNDSMSEGNRDTFNEFQDNTREYMNYILPIRGFSTDVIQAVRDVTQHLDVLFIDGDHSYEGVKADWEAYKGLLKTGSVVVFHDSGWAEGVKRVIDEDVKEFVKSSDSLPNLWWGTISQMP